MPSTIEQQSVQQESSPPEKEQAWEVTNPTGPFWSPFHGTTAKNFIMTYPLEQRPKVLSSLDDSLSKPRKLDFLNNNLEMRLEEGNIASAPSTLREANHSFWSALLLSMRSVAREAGNVVREEELALEMLADGDKGSLMSLCDVYTRTGRLLQAEKTGLQCLEWLDGHEKLGPNSPQSISMTCGIARSIGWQDGRADEGRQVFQKAFMRVEGMKGDKRWADFYDYSRGIVTKEKAEWEAAYEGSNRVKQA